MKVRELIEILNKAHPNSDVEIVVDEDWDNPYAIEDIDMDPEDQRGRKVFIITEPS